MHDVLSDPYRCAVLYYLEESDEAAGVRELTEQVLAWCLEEGQFDGDEGVDDHACTWLLERHVLSMERFGLISYDRERDAVALSDDASIAITPRWEE